MKIGIDCGHTLLAPDTGAQGCLGKEETRTREIGRLVIEKLRSLGHTVIECKTDYANTVTESLAYRVNKANSNNVDIFVSIHLNAFNKSAHGTEVYVSPNASQKSKDLGQKVVRELAKLGFTNRGVNANNLYVCNHTNMPAILVECCFVDSITDMKLYNANKIASAIVTGITGQSVISSTSSSAAANSYKGWVYELQGIIGAKQDNIAGPETLGKCPLLKYGSKGNAVKLLQKRLISLGYSCGSCGADGDFGQGTKNAVIRYQRANVLVADGIVGQNTWRKLLEL